MKKNHLNRNFILLFFGIFLLLGFSTLFAAKSHKHGNAEIKINYVKDLLEIMINTPAKNILGFENPPASKRDQKIVRKRYDTLIRKVRFKLPDLCRPEQLTFKGNGFESNDDFEVEFGPSSGEDEHSDMEIGFTYQCSPKEKVKSIDFKTLFKVFPGFKKIEVAILTDAKKGKKRGKKVLTPKTTIVKLQ